MISSQDLTSLKELLARSNSVLVILNAQPSYDQKLAAAGLFLSLKQAGKKVGFFAPEQVYSTDIPGFDQLKNKLGKQNLLISFDYDKKKVDKVSYHIDEQHQKFYLSVKPQKGKKPLDASKVKFDYTGAEADLILTIGVKELEELDQLYFGYEDLYRNGALVTIDNFEPDWGAYNLDVSGYSCMSEALVVLIRGMGLELDAAAATNLLLGIQHQTNNFTALTASADTFETVAELIRSGARRSKSGQEQPSTPVAQSAESNRSNQVQTQQVPPEQPQVQQPPAQTQLQEQPELQNQAQPLAQAQLQPQPPQPPQPQPVAEPQPKPKSKKSSPSMDVPLRPSGLRV